MLILEDFYANRPVRVYEETAPTLRAERYGLKAVCAMRGRNSENPNDRTPKKEGSIWIQRLEPNVQGISNTLTTVPKDNMLLTDESGNYDVRNLTPKECWRLMSYSDEDYEKAAEVTSQTQLYKQAGNAIVEEVLKALFKQFY